MKTLLEIYQEEPSGFGQGDKGTTHNYIQEYYGKAFESYRNTSNGVLEVGIYYGHSIRMWRKYFEKAKIYGIDIKNENSVCPGCELIYADATVSKSFDSVSNLDVIIDDGAHIPSQQIATFNILFPKLNSEGIYVIEDVIGEHFDNGTFNNLHPDMKVYDMRYHNGQNDNIIIEVIKE